MDACTVMKREKRHNASGISNEGMQFLAMLRSLYMVRSQALKGGDEGRCWVYGDISGRKA